MSFWHLPISDVNVTKKADIQYLTRYLQYKVLENQIVPQQHVHLFITMLYACGASGLISIVQSSQLGIHKDFNVKP